MNKSQQDQRARKHGEHNQERRERARHLRLAGKHLSPSVIPKLVKPIPKPQAKAPAKPTGFFKRMFRRVTGGA